jgi:gliding motility-associated-like protein
MTMHSEVRIQIILIFDRYGALLAQINPESQGWDGQINGKPLPASNYWFRARDVFNNELTGYFALKR